MVRIPCLFSPFPWGFSGEVLALRFARFARHPHQIAVEAGRHSCHALNISEGSFQPPLEIAHVLIRAATQSMQRLDFEREGLRMARIESMQPSSKGLALEREALLHLQSCPIVGLKQANDRRIENQFVFACCFVTPAILYLGFR